MSAPTLTETGAVKAPGAANNPARRSSVIIEDKACIPAWVDDLESFQLTQQTDPLGHPQYKLQARSEEESAAHG